MFSSVSVSSSSPFAREEPQALPRDYSSAVPQALTHPCNAMPRRAMQHAHHLLRSDPLLPSSQAFDRLDRYKQSSRTRSNSMWQHQQRVQTGRHAETQKKQGHAGPRRATHTTPAINLHDCSCSCSAEKVCICRKGKAVFESRTTTQQ